MEHFFYRPLHECAITVVGALGLTGRDMQWSRAGQALLLLTRGLCQK